MNRLGIHNLRNLPLPRVLKFELESGRTRSNGEMSTGGEPPKVDEWFRQAATPKKTQATLKRPGLGAKKTPKSTPSSHQKHVKKTRPRPPWNSYLTDDEKYKVSKEKEVEKKRNFVRVISLPRTNSHRSRHLKFRDPSMLRLSTRAPRRVCRARDHV